MKAVITSLVTKKHSCEQPYGSVMIRCSSEDQIDGLVQNCSVSIAKALEILQSWTKPSRYTLRRQLKLYINVTRSYEGWQDVSNDNTTFFRTTSWFSDDLIWSFVIRRSCEDQIYLPCSGNESDLNLTIRNYSYKCITYSVWCTYRSNNAFRFMWWKTAKTEGVRKHFIRVAEEDGVAHEDAKKIMIPWHGRFFQKSRNPGKSVIIQHEHARYNILHCLYTDI